MNFLVKSQQRRYFVFEVSFLLMLFIFIGIATVPAHWTSIWMDREFTGWVAPISNRIAVGQKLYADGAHMPMPPLPFVFVYLLSGGKATWYLESILNYLFQILTIITLYFGFSLHFQKPIPFVSALACIPIFLSLPKTILYDSMTQFWVALLSITAVSYALERSKEANPDYPVSSKVRSLLVLSVMSILTAVCILSKQSTGLGALIGVVCLLGIFPRSCSNQSQIKDTTYYVFATVVALGIGSLALSPFINVSGLFTDVFLTGSEPKGGSIRMVSNLVGYSTEIVKILLNNWLFAFLIFGIFGSVEFFAPRSYQLKKNATEFEKLNTDKSQIALLYLASILGVLSALIMTIKFNKQYNYLADTDIGNELLSTGLSLCIFITIYVIFFQKSAKTTSQLNLAPIAAFFLVTFTAALFHSLSVGGFRWTYDNNPLIYLALVSMILALSPKLAVFSKKSKLLVKSKTALTVGIIFILQISMWAVHSPHFSIILRCTETWPEVSFLTGARLQKSAQGMRDLVNLVRHLAEDKSKDDVLLLPNDPNVEAWFERPRPNLSAAIVFTDQYWDRYVDEDFTRLLNKPPKVILIGPRNYWRMFQRYWNKNVGAERLIDRVEQELLPQYYKLYTSQEISFQSKKEFMDVYLRKEPDKQSLKF